MSRVTPEIGTPCLTCERPMDRELVKHHSHGLCEKCYIKRYWKGYRGRPSNPKVKIAAINIKKNESCITCNVVYADASKTSGKYGAKGMCKKCYHRVLVRSKIEKCEECGGSNGTTNPKCMMCRKIERDTVNFNHQIMAMEDVFNNNSNSFRRKGSISKYIGDDLLLKIKMLLIKYKWNMNTKVDDFRVCDVYYSLYSNDYELDAFNVKAQVNYMLKVLTKVYQLNKKPTSE